MLLLTLHLLAAPAVPPVAPDPPAGEAATPIALHSLHVAIDGFADEAVLAALRLRLPRLVIARHGDAAAVGAPDIYLRVARGIADDTGILQAVTADGRAFERTFVIEVGHEVRVVATTAVHLLFAIEHGTLPPDRHNVAIPPPASDPPPEVEPAPKPAEPAPKPDGPAPKPDDPTPAPGRPGAPTRPWELALVVHGAGVLGLGPPAQDRAFAAGGGGLGVELRGPRGLAATLELRGAGLRSGDLDLARLRIGLGAGYILRRGRFELPIVLVVAVEPWWPRQAGGGGTTLYKGDAVAVRQPLLAGHLRVAPGLRLALARGPLRDVRIGPRLEFGGGFVVDDGARAVDLTAPDGTSRARLGGFELAIGLELALQFTLRRGP